MSLKIFVIGIIFTIILAFTSFFLIIFLFSPENAESVLFALVFLSLFIGFSGIFSLFGIFFRRKKHKGGDSLKFVAISFRQGTLLAFLLVGSLFFKAFGVGWWASVLLLGLVLAIEVAALKELE